MKRQFFSITMLDHISPNYKPNISPKVKETLETLGLEVLPHSPYSPDIAPLDYHLFRSMQSALTEQKLSSFAVIKNWLDN